MTCHCHFKLRCPSRHVPITPAPYVPVLWEAGHELRVAGVGQLLEVGRLEALVGLGALRRVVHEEEVEEAQSGRAQPREDRLQVVVRLRLQGEVLHGYILT